MAITYQWAAIALSATLLAACGGGSGISIPETDDPIVEGVPAPMPIDVELDTQTENMNSTENAFGVISLRINNNQTPLAPEFSSEAGAFATFNRTNELLTPDDLESFYTLPTDSCVVSNLAGDVFFFFVSSIRLYQPFQNTNIELTDIDVGDVILFSSNQTTFVESVRQQLSDTIFYRNEIDITDLSPPSNLVIDVPGSNSFPAFSVSLDDTERPVLISPSENEINRFDTVFEWETANNSDTFIRLTAFKIVGQDRVLVDCYMEDDGRFMFPDTVFDTIEPSLLNDFSFNISRGRSVSVVENSSLLLILYYVGM